MYETWVVPLMLTKESAETPAEYVVKFDVGAQAAENLEPFQCLLFRAQGSGVAVCSFL